MLAIGSTVPSARSRCPSQQKFISLNGGFGELLPRSGHLSRPHWEINGRSRCCLDEAPSRYRRLDPPIEKFNMDPGGHGVARDPPKG